MLVSIIVPVYKAEKYIERCVRSLMEQSMCEDIEFIFVDDSSPDRSIEILNSVLYDYPQRLANVKILHNEVNLGIAKSRKKGIDNAAGMFIGWCDSDDWCEHDMYEHLWRGTDGGAVDIVICDYYRNGANEQQKVMNNYKDDPYKALEFAYDIKQFAYSLWNQLIRADLLKKAFANIVPTNMGEDLYALIHCYYNAESMNYLKNEFLYHYNVGNVESITRSLNWPWSFWLEQKENIDKIEVLLGNRYKSYRKMLNVIKYNAKIRCRSLFPNDRVWFDTYSESHRYIIYNTQIPIFVRIKLMLLMSNYMFFFCYKRFLGK